MTVDFSRMLVAVDFSPTSDHATDYAAALAARLGASIELLHVVDDRLNVEGWGVDGFLVDVPKTLDELLEEARARLQLRANWLGQGAVAVAVRVVAGAPAQAIVDAARADRCTLVVMGTHGRTGIAHALMGSIAERVVRTAPCPVVTVRGPEQLPAESQFVADATMAPIAAS
jgi:nucleotide-binding universal stress UspA family protein